MTIWKFQIPMQAEFTIEMPANANIIHVAEQEGFGHVWAMVNPSADEKQERRFSLIGTGHAFNPGNKRYIGTIHIGEFVWHLFEII